MLCPKHEITDRPVRHRSAGIPQPCTNLSRCLTPKGVRHPTAPTTPFMGQTPHATPNTSFKVSDSKRCQTPTAPPTPFIRGGVRHLRSQTPQRRYTAAPHQPLQVSDSERCQTPHRANHTLHGVRHLRNT